MAGIEQHWAAVQRIEAQLQADAATVEFTAPADLDITVDGQAAHPGRRAELDPARLGRGDRGRARAC